MKSTTVYYFHEFKFYSFRFLRIDFIFVRDNKTTRQHRKMASSPRSPNLVNLHPCEYPCTDQKDPFVISFEQRIENLDGIGFDPNAETVSLKQFQLKAPTASTLSTRRTTETHVTSVTRGDAQPVPAPECSFPEEPLQLKATTEASFLKRRNGRKQFQFTTDNCSICYSNGPKCGPFCIGCGTEPVSPTSEGFAPDRTNFMFACTDCNRMDPPNGQCSSCGRKARTMKEFPYSTTDCKICHCYGPIGLDRPPFCVGCGCLPKAAPNADEPPVLYLYCMGECNDCHQVNPPAGTECPSCGRRSRFIV